MSLDTIGIMYLVKFGSGHSVEFILRSLSMQSWNKIYDPTCEYDAQQKCLSQGIGWQVGNMIICADKEDFDFSMTIMITKMMLEYIDMVGTSWV